MFAFVVLLASSSPVFASTSINSQWTNTPPTIDGVVGSREWSNQQLHLVPADGYPIEAYVYVLNDASNLYFLVDAVGDTIDGANDECLLTFNYESSLPYFQHYARISGNTTSQSTSGNIVFEGSLGFNGHKVYEFAILLSNINAQPGQVIDFCSPAYGVKAASMPYDPDSNPIRDNVWPAGLNVTDLNSWGVLNTQRQQYSPPSDPSGHVGGELFAANKLAVLSPYLALIGFVAVAAVLVKRRKV